jgi:zinc ribbon protein
MLPPLSARWHDGAAREERRVSEREMDERQHEEETVVCTVCGTVNLASDRYCAECGAPLPLQASPADGETSAAPLQTGMSTPDASRAPRTTEKENAAWIFGARPAAVVGGGLLLLLLAAALLAIGQRDETGTIVMLSFCAAPLGLLVLIIGIARYFASATRRG